MILLQQKIIEEFDPAAKKLREAEEKASKDALTKSQQKPSQVPVRTAGKAEKKGDFYLPSLNDAGIGGYSGAGGAPYGGGRAGSDHGSDAGTGDKTKGGSTTSGAGGKSGAAGDGKDAGKDASKANDAKGKAPEPITAIKNPDVKNHVESFKKALTEANGFALPLQANV